MSSGSLAAEVEALTRHPGVSWTGTQSLNTAAARNKLQPRHSVLFQDSAAGTTTTALGSLFHRFATAVCRTRSVARKEVFETWAAALTIHDHFFSSSNTTSIRRVVDVAGGHGLLAWALLILDDFYSCASPKEPLTAFCLDNTMPKSVDPIATEMIQQWPQLENRMDFVEAWLQQLQPHPSCLLVSVHACAGLSDLLIDKAAQYQVPIALVPCCHSRKKKHIQLLAEESLFAANDYQELLLLDGHDKMPDLADRLDHIRVNALVRANFEVSNAHLPTLFSAKTRVILGVPTADVADKRRQLSRPTTMPPLSAQDMFLSKFTVPCQDTVEARAAVRVLAGRDAARQRREARQRKNQAPAPTFHLSLWAPKDAAEVVGFAADLERLLCTMTTAANRPLRCQVSKYGQPFVPKSSGRQSQMFQMAYYCGQEEGGESIQALSKDEAKHIHGQVCGIISEEFPGWECRGGSLKDSKGD